MKKNVVISLILASVFVLCSTVGLKADNTVKKKSLQVKLLLTQANVDSIFSRKNNRSCMILDTGKFNNLLQNELESHPWKILDVVTLQEGENTSKHYKRIFDHPVFGYNEVNTKIKRPVFSKKIKVSVKYSGEEDVTFKKQAKQHFKIREESSVTHVCRIQTGANYNLMLTVDRVDVNSIGCTGKNREETKGNLPLWASKIAEQHQIDTNRMRYMPGHSKLTGFCRNHHYPLSDLFFNEKKKEKILKEAVLIYHPNGNDQYYIIQSPKVIHKTTHPLGWREDWGPWKLSVQRGKVSKFNEQQNEPSNEWEAKKLILEVKHEKVQIRIEEMVDSL